LPGEPVDRNNPARNVALDDARQRLWEAARETLTDSQFAALYLHAAEQMVIEEIARTLKKTRTHVKVLLHRARGRLVRELSQGNEGLTAIRDAAREAQRREVIRVAEPDFQCQ
jgi:DNA-directed RNA polymerase specialized sigma24 family protein